MTRVRLATVAAIRTWNSVLCRPKYRAWRTPNWVIRAMRCSTTWRCFSEEVKVRGLLPRFGSLHGRLVGVHSHLATTLGWLPRRSSLEAHIAQGTGRADGP